MGLAAADETPQFTALTGGVSSDIWKVDLARGPVCIKRALAQLKVAATWRAPVERNASEVGWIEVARQIVAGCAPRILGHDPQAGLFAMEFFDPADYRLWKSDLRDGLVDLAMAAAVGDTLGRIHATTAGDSGLSHRFGNDTIFHDIRLEPYLIAAGRAHPDRAGALKALATTTAQTRQVLVHGDVSPKNILLGPDGPVFLDAECAWYGDPAFDLGFCLNHLLLKCLWTPRAAALFLDAFDALSAASVGSDGVNLSTVSLTSQTAAAAAIDSLDSAIASVSSQRANLGANQNRLEHTIKNLSVSAENLSAAESRIRDTDMASEMVTFTRNQIMQQAGTSMLAQANQVPQSVLSLLR